MKIIHIVWQMSMGGAETMLVDIANIQVETEEVHIIAINDNQNLGLMNKLDSRVRFFCCGRELKSHSIIPFIRLNIYLLRNSPDIIHIHFARIYKYIYYKGIKVRTIHNTNYDIKEYKHYNQCYAISKSVVEEWRHMGIDIPLVMNGINCNLVRYKYRPNDIRNDTNRIWHFIQVSRLHVLQKGQDILIEALAKVKAYLNNNSSANTFVMHFIGEGEDENLLKEIVKKYNLDDNVLFEGVKDRDWVYANLCNFDLFIQPSRYEGFGLTVAEACVAKIPVLVSDNEGPLEIIDGGRLGMTFQNKNVDDLADKIIKVLHGKYNYMLIEPAYQHILSHYDVRQTAMQYIEEYIKLMSK